jgi:DinB superfamily
MAIGVRWAYPTAAFGHVVRYGLAGFTRGCIFGPRPDCAARPGAAPHLGFVAVERCEDCGFAWETVSREEIPRRVDEGTATIAGLLAGDPDRAGVRPSTQRWSALEYAAHVRDVLITLRDRLVVGLVEDLPSFKPMYRDERVDLGLYGADTVEAVAVELRAATTMFIRLFDAIDPHGLSRRVHYGFPNPAQRSLLWMGQQAVHEVEHHSTDIADNLRRIAN